MISDESNWSYRIPFALQWIFPIPIFVAVYFAPESPWWLIRQNRFVDAKKSLRRLRTKPKTQSDALFDAKIDGTLETMIQTNEHEQEMQSGTSYKDCFKGVDRRRTEITCMVWIIQTLCGGTFMGFSTYFCKPTFYPQLNSIALPHLLNPRSILTTPRRTSRPRLLPRLHPLSLPIRPRAPRRMHILGPHGALRPPHPLPLWPSHHLPVRPAHRHPSLYPTALQ
jgi:hypothetical protein